jgi:DNA replication protein DnaC
MSALAHPAQLERLTAHLLKLRLFKSRERLEALLQDAAAQELAYADFLERVLSEEVAAKTSKNVTMRTSMARFPFVKPLESFDFAYQPSIDKKQVQQLASCHFHQARRQRAGAGAAGGGQDPRGCLGFAQPLSSRRTIGVHRPIPNRPSHRCESPTDF